MDLLFTGSKGSLGLHQLRDLLDDPNALKIFCLNRSAGGKEIPQSRFVSLGLDENINPPRRELPQVNYAQGQLGLADTQYQVNFNHSLKSYSPTRLQGVPKSHRLEPLQHQPSVHHLHLLNILSLDLDNRPSSRSRSWKTNL